jgi:non-heme chloroperoxidase
LFLLSRFGTIKQIVPTAEVINMLKSSNISTAPSPDAVKLPFIQTQDGTTLFYKDWGTGQPVVFIHGWGVGADMWEYQMTALVNQGLRCIAYDKRGCGRSSQPSQGYDYDTFGDDLAALINQLDLHNVTLVAHSSGGGDVARYLSRYGDERIARTVLIGSITPYLIKTSDNSDGLDWSLFEGMIAELNQDRPQYLSKMAPGFFGVGLPQVSISSEMIQWAISLALQASPQATIAMVDAFKTDFRPDMSAFTMPTLIIHGDHDQSHPVDLTGRRTAQAISGSQLKVYEGAAHGLFITHKDHLNRDLLAFIQD